jgi:A/G-specific adenine glycosylase
VALRADNAVLLRTREAKGLLGGMVETPTSAWAADYDVAKAMLDAPIEARWKRLPGHVRHVFTHFPLNSRCFSPGSNAPPRRRTGCAGPLGKASGRRRCPAR